MKVRFHLFIFILLFFGASFAKAQRYIYTVRGLLGTHFYQDQGHLLQDKIYGGEFSVAKNISCNADEWIKRSRAKTAGLDFVFRDLSSLKGAKDTAAGNFGQVFGLAAHLEFEMLQIGQAKLIFKPSVGLAYTNKYYYNSPKNRFIGTPINELIKADIGGEIPLANKTTLMAGFNFVHISNGGQTVPNGGLNTGNLYLGLKFGRQDSSATGRKSSYQTLRRNFIELDAGFGQRGVYEKRHQHLYKSGFFAGYGYYINDFISLKAGADAVYYFDRYHADQNMETFQYYASSFEKWRAGISLGADLNLWRITVNGQLGKYFYFKRLYPEASWYWTFGPTFNITNKIGIQAKTYMHFAQADYINYGLVYRL